MEMLFVNIYSGTCVSGYLNWDSLFSLDPEYGSHATKKRVISFPPPVPFCHPCSGYESVYPLETVTVRRNGAV